MFMNISFMYNFKAKDLYKKGDQVILLSIKYFKIPNIDITF